MSISQSIYDFNFTTVEGEKIQLSNYKGKKLLIVNTASKCGYTPQYEKLQKLYEMHGDKLMIVAFPSNDFGGQEPLENTEIADFCSRNYRVTFPVVKKILVKGNKKHPFFQLITELENPDFTGEISWNFEKFLFDESGNLIRRFKTKTDPLDVEIISAIY